MNSHVNIITFYYLLFHVKCKRAGKQMRSINSYKNHQKSEYLDVCK